MLAKEEIKKSLNDLAEMSCIRSYTSNESYKILSQFIDEHFELVEEYEKYKSMDNFLKQIEKFYVDDTYFGHIVKAISQCEDKITREYAIHCLTYLKQQLSIYENPQPYKLKDLKVGMWVWDSKIEKCNKILEINNDKIGFYYVTDNLTRFTCKFEENRFYPVQMANVGCE